MTCPECGAVGDHDHEMHCECSACDHLWETPAQALARLNLPHGFTYDPEPWLAPQPEGEIKLPLGNGDVLVMRRVQVGEGVAFTMELVSGCFKLHAPLSCASAGRLRDWFAAQDIDDRTIFGKVKG
jgi:hypothetical protein